MGIALNDLVSLARSVHVGGYKRTSKSGKVVSVEGYVRMLKGMSTSELGDEIKNLKSDYASETDGNLKNQIRTRQQVAIRELAARVRGAGKGSKSTKVPKDGWSGYDTEGKKVPSGGPSKPAKTGGEFKDEWGDRPATKVRGYNDYSPAEKTAYDATIEAAKKKYGRIAPEDYEDARAAAAKAKPATILNKTETPDYWKSITKKSDSELKLMAADTNFRKYDRENAQKELDKRASSKAEKPGPSNHLDPKGDLLAQYKSGKAMYNSKGDDDFGREALSLMSDKELAAAQKWRAEQNDKGNHGHAGTMDDRIIMKEWAKRAAAKKAAPSGNNTSKIKMLEQNLASFKAKRASAADKDSIDRQIAAVKKKLAALKKH